MYIVIGILLDDLLVAEDPAPAEMATAGAVAASGATDVQAGRFPGRYAIFEERAREPEPVGDGSVVLGSPVARAINGDIYTDINAGNAMLQGSG